MSNELYHHGVKGQRWGVRRYQNADGSLTALGKKRADTAQDRAKKKAANIKAKAKKKEAAVKAKYAKKIAAVRLKKLKEVQARKLLEAERAEKEEAQKLKDAEKLKSAEETSSPKTQSFKKRTVKEMSDDELRERTNRLRLEKDFMEAERNHYLANENLKSIEPKKVSAGKEFAKKLFNEAILPTAKNIGKEYLESQLKSKLGLDVEDAYTVMKKEVDMLNLKKQKKELTDALTDSELKKLRRENDMYQVREQNEKYKHQFSDEGKREQAMKNAVDNMRSASQFVSNAKIVNEGKKYFEKEFDSKKTSEQAYKQAYEQYGSYGEDWVDKYLLK